MPSVCLAFLPPGEKKTSVPHDSVLNFLNAVTDAFIRESLSSITLSPARRNRTTRNVPLPEQWLQALSSDDPKLTASAEDLKRSEEHTSELQSHLNLVCRLLLEKKKKITPVTHIGTAFPAASPSRARSHLRPT